MLLEISFQDFLDMDLNFICTKEIPDNAIMKNIISESELVLSDPDEKENEISPKTDLETIC